MKISGSLISILIVYSLRVSAESDTALIQIGKPMPDFELNNVTDYQAEHVSLQDFKGKWLFLDFWFTGCAACIESFPKVNSIQQEFKASIQYLLIGVNSKEYGSGIAELYERIKKKQGLRLASAYDSVLVKKWGIRSMPHIIIVSPEGIVKFITDGRDMTGEKVSGLIAGNPVEFFPKTREGAVYSSNNVPADHILYKSTLSKWYNENQVAGDIERFPQMDLDYKKNGFKAIMVPLYSLYNQAYMGRWQWAYMSDSLYGVVSPEPVLEIKDSSLFRYDYNTWPLTGLYNYNLILPVGNIGKGKIMQILRDDLKNTFGYTVSIENRKMPVWQLVRISGQNKNLTTKGGEEYIGDGTDSYALASGFKARNISIKTFLTVITYYLVGQSPFIDQTGIENNIDITIDADMTSISSIKNSLRKSGLDLVEGEKEMKVIVISDHAETDIF